MGPAGQKLVEDDGTGTEKTVTANKLGKAESPAVSTITGEARARWKRNEVKHPVGRNSQENL
jgi:hypothetical protein